MASSSRKAQALEPLLACADDARAYSSDSASELSVDDSTTNDLVEEVARLTKLVEEQGKTITSLQAIVTALQRSGRPSPPPPPLTSDNPVIKHLQQQINTIATVPHGITNDNPTILNLQQQINTMANARTKSYREAVGQEIPVLTTKICK
jgi:hypothetical protein